MTQKPLSCIRSKPVLDFKLPVDKKYYIALPTILFSKVFFIYYNYITLDAFADFTLFISFIIFALK